MAKSKKEKVNQGTRRLKAVLSDVIKNTPVTNLTALPFEVIDFGSGKIINRSSVKKGA